MIENLSKTQVDRLGDRIRKGPLSESDLRLLDDYRRSFGEAYETVVQIIRERLQLEPTGRPAKSTGAIIEKLRRESIRLSQIQDIAGCRVVIADVAEQERVTTALLSAFPGASIVDRRANPSYGYRAVHVVVSTSGKLMEVQVRTSLQHLWAELSEKLSDIFDPDIKYGGGDELIHSTLAQFSENIANLERKSAELDEIEKRFAHLSKMYLKKKFPQESEKLQEEMAQSRVQIAKSKEKLTKTLNNLISVLEKLKG